MPWKMRSRREALVGCIFVVAHRPEAKVSERNRENPHFFVNSAIEAY
jgi:hypothetical protein